VCVVLFSSDCRSKLDIAFLWLALALFIDAIDGPLARLVDTKARLPRFSGERLDLIVDYLNYVVLPAFMVVKGPIIDGVAGYIAAALMLTTSLFHFSDTSSKTKDGYFVGFPAIWNIVIFYLLAFEGTGRVAFAMIFVLAFMTFVPIKWLHPFRVTSFRRLTAGVVFIWSLTVVMILLHGFEVSAIEKTALIAVVIYFIAVSMKRTTAMKGGKLKSR
jgi:phosphatidylcholine synthase